MAGSVLDALLKAGVVKKEETPQARKQVEQESKQKEEQRRASRAVEEASSGPDRSPAFEAPARAVAKTSDPAEGLKVRDELTQEMKDWFADGERDVDALLASGDVTPEMIKKLWETDRESPGFVPPRPSKLEI